MKSQIKNILLISLIIAGTGCSKGFSGSQLSPTDNITQGDGTINPNLQKVSYKGTQAQGDKVGRLILEMDRINEAVVLVLPLPTEILALLGPIPSIRFPDLPGAHLDVRPDGMLAVSIPLKYIVRNGKFKDPSFQRLLPNGDPLPAFPAGEGNGFALEITRKYKIHLYIGVNAAAVFIETPDLDKTLNCGNSPICPPLGPWQVLNENGQQIIGYVSLVYSKGNYHSGAYVTGQFPDGLAAFIDDHLRF
jgi:hypothetical protein